MNVLVCVATQQCVFLMCFRIYTEQSLRWFLNMNEKRKKNSSTNNNNNKQTVSPKIEKYRWMFSNQEKREEEEKNVRPLSIHSFPLYLSSYLYHWSYINVCVKYENDLPSHTWIEPYLHSYSSCKKILKAKILNILMKENAIIFKMCRIWNKLFNFKSLGYFWI